MLKESVAGSVGTGPFAHCSKLTATLEAGSVIKSKSTGFPTTLRSNVVSVPTNLDKITLYVFALTKS